MPYYHGDPKRDHNFDNHACVYAVKNKDEGVSRSRVNDKSTWVQGLEFRV